MKKAALALVEIGFDSRPLRHEDEQEVVKILRTVAGVDDFSVHYGKISFHLWGDKEVNYGILDKIKDLLVKNYPALTIQATEYLKTGRDYAFEGNGRKTH